MKLGFCLFKYFPYGGLQRDFMDIALACQSDGHEIYVYTLKWQGERPQGFNIRVIDAHAWFNHNKYVKYHRQMMELSAQDQLDCRIGFNKMPGLDIYFASDPCYKARPHHLIERLWARYRHFLEYERAVFGPDSQTHILTIAPTQQAEYAKAWHLHDSRSTLLPPGISRDAMPGPDTPADRDRIRTELGIKANEFLLLMIGSGFRTKGLDRAVLAVDALPRDLRDRTKLIVIGQDKPDRYNRQIMQMGLSQHIRILPGRDDIAAVMQAGDCLLHPAYREVAGKVILEAVVGGLPVLVSDVCGYAHHVSEADAGEVFSSPFLQHQFNQRLQHVLQDADLRQRWRDNGIRYGQQHNLYEMANAAASEIQSRCSQQSQEVAA